MITLIILSLVIFLAYVVGTCLYFGIPYSISDTYYKLEKRKKGLGWLFTAMCWSVGGLLLPSLLDITPECYQFTAFFACAGLIFIGAAPQFKLSLTGAVHYGSAAICIVFSQIWVGLTYYLTLLAAWACFIAYTYTRAIDSPADSWRDRFISTRPMFWAEIAALVATYIAVFVQIL